jgi:hypothetical protein
MDTTGEGCPWNVVDRNLDDGSNDESKVKIISINPTLILKVSSLDPLSSGVFDESDLRHYMLDKNIEWDFRLDKSELIVDNVDLGEPGNDSGKKKKMTIDWGQENVLDCEEKVKEKEKKIMATIDWSLIDESLFQDIVENESHRVENIEMSEGDWDSARFAVGTLKLFKIYFLKLLTKV